MSAQLHSFSSQTQVDKELLFIFDKAHYLSKRAGWAWSLIRNGRRVNSGSGMFGYPASNLHIPVDETCNQGALYLSSPPHAGFITWDELLPNLKAANILEVNIPSVLEGSISLDDSRRQQAENGIEIFCHEVKGIGSQSYYGAYCLKMKKRPWITCVTATGIGGGNVDLSNFYDEFGFKQRVIGKIRGSHALIIDPRINCEVFKKIRNVAGCRLQTHEYESIEGLKAFLRGLELMDLSTVVAIVHHDLYQTMLSLGLIDELSISYELMSLCSNVQSTFTILDYKDWQITECSPLSSGINVEFINKPF
ncbi:hypothetical protein JK628_03370 [Shewanella sp. KX20019]|uniref:hypothetical protein n=1 Tax=Shewanella sp. KX20019 TaxID=2803864 RepID=UPI001925AEEA|nr:hypothetical protein [Shewanella sp. KX20019]QQX80928.1 hypothetical protein JK628_03370 [Shewanella sp. KX20019]